MKPLKALEHNLKRLREQRGWTQVKAAEKARIEYKHYQKIEIGKWDGLRLATIEGLAEAFEVEAWELLVPPSSITQLAISDAAKKVEGAPKAVRKLKRTIGKQKSRPRVDEA